MTIVSHDNALPFLIGSTSVFVSVDNILFPLSINLFLVTFETFCEELSRECKQRGRIEHL